MENFEGKKITVFGLGKSGVAAAKKLVFLQAKVFVTEIKSSLEFDSSLREEFQKLGVKLEFGGHTIQSVQDTELIVVSPGVRLDISILEQAKEKDIPIISEVELAYRLLSKPLLAVTGTNGKTTTAILIGEMLRAAGKKVAVAGNIGTPLISVDDSDLDFIVAEISSYQLETIVTFKPWVSLILNIAEDHLERHISMEEYTEKKARIFMNQDENDFLIYNADDFRVSMLAARAKAKLVSFSKQHPEILLIDPSQIQIPGKHNLENALAASQAAYLCGVNKVVAAEVLRTFSGVEHRIEYVRTLQGIDFYNDSKATNPDSTLVALNTFPNRGIILILGGRDKGTSLDALCQKVKERVKDVILMGEATERFKKALEGVNYQNIYLAASLEEAVNLSFSLGEEGDMVLLSPACASFDRYANFEERGRTFKKICQNLK